jgi:GNAT superfamily N-acetyltransferase
MLLWGLATIVIYWIARTLGTSPTLVVIIWGALSGVAYLTYERWWRTWVLALVPPPSQQLSHPAELRTAAPRPIATSEVAGGYTIGTVSRPTYPEIAELRTANGWDTDTEPRWREILDTALAVATARHTDGTLVGMGVLSGSVRHAVLCDLDVHPDHRHRGIGRALVQARLDAAATLGCRYLYVSLSADNPFRDLYAAAGVTTNALCGELVTRR